MRIAFDAFSLGSTAAGGNRTYTVELIKALARGMPDISLLLATYWNRRQRTEALFCDVPGCSVANLFPQPRMLGNGLRFLVSAATPLCERILAKRCDLFHCTNPTNFPFHVPTVVTTILDLIGLRDEPWAQASSKVFFREHIGEIVQRSAHLFAISDFTRREIIAQFPSAEGKITVTPLAASPIFRVVEKDRSFLARHGLTDTQRPYLLAVGDIQPRKNITGLVAAFASLPERYEDLHLVLIGQARNRTLSAPALAAIDASPARDRIHVLHTVGDEDLVLFYNNAEVLLYFSFFEGFGLPIVEAMQCGCPVAASNTSSMREIAEGAAIMVDPYDLESMRNGIVMMLDSSALREEFRDKGLQRASQYTWTRTAELTFSGYAQALA